MEETLNKELVKQLADLKFNDLWLQQVCFFLHRAIERLKIPNVVISKTGDNELLFYTEKDGCFKNLLVDKDGDIEYLYIPKKVKETDSKVYDYLKGHNYTDIAKNLIQ